VAQQDVRGRGEPHAATVGLEQGDGEFLGEPTQLLGDRRRGQVQRGGGGGDRAECVDHPQDLDPSIHHEARLQIPVHKREMDLLGGGSQAGPMHTICALQEVSRHRTSEGLVSYHRCRCGRLDVRRHDVAILSSAGGRPSGPTSDRASTAPARGSRVVATVGAGAAAVPVAVLMLLAGIAVPQAALLAGVGLGLFVGALAGVGAGFVAADPRQGVRVAVITAAAAVPVVIAGAGLIAALGPVSVIALPLLYAVAGLAWWVRQS
jgi:hypothetical protein